MIDLRAGEKISFVQKAGATYSTAYSSPERATLSFCGFRMSSYERQGSQLDPKEISWSWARDEPWTSLSESSLSPIAFNKPLVDTEKRRNVFNGEYMTCIHPGIY